MTTTYSSKIIIVAAVGLALGCGKRTVSNIQLSADPADQSHRDTVDLEDGVYPVIQRDDDSLTTDSVHLQVIPVTAEESATEHRIKVATEPILTFRGNSDFDFKFENEQCTEIGFQNSDCLKAYTREYVGARLAIVIDNRVVSSHKIREAIESDRVRITCCTVGGGDHLYRHLTQLKNGNRSDDSP